MAFKIEDFVCKKCEFVTEILLDSNEENQELKCDSCGSEDVEKTISIGTGKGGHISWSKWRA